MEPVREVQLRLALLPEGEEATHRLHPILPGKKGVVTINKITHKEVVISMDVFKQSVPLWLVAILLAVSFVSTAVALTVNSLNSQRISLWSGNVQDTDFSVTNYDVQHKGKNKVNLLLDLTNTDPGNAHQANVTVQLLNSNGDVLIEETQQTGSVTASGTWSTTFVFAQTDIVSQYDNVFIEIKQTS